MLLPSLPLTSRLALAGAALAVLTGCAREDEAAMRERLDRWFSLGETLSFAAELDCAAGLFRLVDDSLAASLPVVGSVGEMLFTLPREGVAALDDPEQAPDAALVDLVNADRPMGMAMRRAGLEARACMDEATEGAFRTALLSPGALLVYETESGMVALMDRENRLVVAAMGAE